MISSSSLLSPSQSSPFPSFLPTLKHNHRKQNLPMPTFIVHHVTRYYNVDFQTPEIRDQKYCIAMSQTISHLKFLLKNSIIPSHKKWVVLLLTRLIPTIPFSPIHLYQYHFIHKVKTMGSKALRWYRRAK